MFLTCENLSRRKKVAHPSMAIGLLEYTCDSKGEGSNRIANNIEKINRTKAVQSH
jgi:hypothetical protein